MPAKLSTKEKLARGTAQRCRMRGPRSLSAIETDLAELRRLIADLNHNLKIARECVRRDGCLIEVTVTNNHGHFEKTRRLNPAFKVQNDAMKLLKSFSRQLELLTDERALAIVEKQKLQQKESSDEFAV